MSDKITLEKDLLIGLQKKRDYGLETVQDKKERSKRMETLEKLEKEMKKTECNRIRQQKFRDERKRKIASLDETTRKKVFGKATITPGRPSQIQDEELIQTIARIAIHGSAAHDKRRNEVIRTVKTLDQMTEALQKEGIVIYEVLINWIHQLYRNKGLFLYMNRGS